MTTEKNKMYQGDHIHLLWSVLVKCPLIEICLASLTKQTPSKFVLNLDLCCFLCHMGLPSLTFMH